MNRLHGIIGALVWGIARRYGHFTMSRKLKKMERSAEDRILDAFELTREEAGLEDHRDYSNAQDYWKVRQEEFEAAITAAGRTCPAELKLVNKSCDGVARYECSEGHVLEVQE